MSDKRGKLDVLMASGTSEHLTPGWLLDLVEKVGKIDLDPCGHLLAESSRRAKTVCILPANLPGAGGADGLKQDWPQFVSSNGLAFVNPPYGRALAEWAGKMARSACPTLALVPRPGSIHDGGACSTL